MAVQRPRLPLIPGLSINSNVGKEYFGRHQHLCLPEGTRMLVDRPVMGPPSLYNKTLTSNQPTWLLFDKEALVFDAFYQSTLEEMRYGPALIRQVKIFYYLEDGTMKVIEPKTLNSSHMQGTIVSRQKVPIPKMDNSYYDILHFNIGREVNVFGKVYMIVDCDKFTRSFLNRLGIHVPDPIEVPKLQCLKPRIGQPKATKHVKSEKQFLEFDKKVLKFQGYWDNRDSDYGKVHHLEIYYYLADDTIEIKEKLTEEDSTDMKAIFLKRSPLPKEMPYGLMSPEAIHPEPRDCFCPSDLTIGAPLNVYGRMVILTDCDGFTKEYYRVKYGLDKFDPILPPVPHKKAKPHPKPRMLPPWNGHGTHVDSESNCRYLVPKPAFSSALQFYEKDKLGYDSNIMRFAARLVSNIKDYDYRTFIVLCYLSDDTMAVYESGDRRSSYPIGVFFRRLPVLLPNQDLYTPERPRRYTARDIWVGKSIVINHHCFLLSGADEYTLRYMELNCHEFPKADIKLILEKIKTKFLTNDGLYKTFVSKNIKYIDCDRPHRMLKERFEKAMKEIMCADMTEHEFITIVRHFQDYEPKDTHPKRSVVRGLVYEEILRWLWQDHDRLSEYLLYLDEYQNGSLPEKVLWKALHAVRLPLSDELIRDMMQCLQKTESGEYIIQDLLDFLNFKLKPPPNFYVRPSKSAKCVQLEFPSFGHGKIEEDIYLDWNKFLKSLDLEYMLSEKP